MKTATRAKKVISKYLKEVAQKRRENKRFNVCVKDVSLRVRAAGHNHKNR